MNELLEVAPAPSVVKPDHHHREEALQRAAVGTFTVERYGAEYQPAWDNFVSTGKNATFLFLRDYMDYHRDRFTDHSLLVFHEQVLVAVLPANLRADGVLVSHEGLTFGGLVVSPAATLLEVLHYFHALLRNLSQRKIATLLYKQIPGFYNPLPDAETAYALFLLDARLYRRDCSATITQTARLPLRKGHHCMIKKAINLGIEIIQETTFRPFWDRVLTPGLAARYGVKPVHTLEEITWLASRFPEHIKQFSAYLDGEILAGTTVFETPTVAHTQYAGVTAKGRQSGAQAYLFHTLIDQYKHKRVFDFGISNEQQGRFLNHGLQEWKEGFGARATAHDFYEIATENYRQLAPVLDGHREQAAAVPHATMASIPDVLPARAYFAHAQALIDEGVSVGQGSRIWAFAHLATGAVIGEDCNICDHTFLEGGVRLGHRVTVKCGVYLWNGVVVEDDVFIGPAAVFTNDDRPRSKKYLEADLKTLLREGCSIGANSTMLPNVTIGRWAMVGAGAVVTRNVPDHALVVGNPARWRAWVCRCGEKLTSASGSLLNCKCGLSYEQIAEREVRAIITNGHSHRLPLSNGADHSVAIISRNGHHGAAKGHSTSAESSIGGNTP